METNIVYAPYVMGAGTQAPMFKGRWKTEEEILASLKREIEALYEDRLNELTRD